MSTMRTLETAWYKGNSGTVLHYADDYATHDAAAFACDYHSTCKSYYVVQVGRIDSIARGAVNCSDER